MKLLPRFLLAFLIFYLFPLAALASPLLSTESDPDSFIEGCVNVISGDYSECVIDLAIAGPDTLLLERFYSGKDPIKGIQLGTWRIFPERFLVIGKDPKGHSCILENECFTWDLAFIGERSGGILPYSGLRSESGSTKDPLRIDAGKYAKGMVNTYTEEISGQTNHRNNILHTKGSSSELTLGDGTRRIYHKITKPSFKILGEELIPLMKAELIDPEYFLLSQEVLPSGNSIFYSYDGDGHLISIEMKNMKGKPISWIHFTYQWKKGGILVLIDTSDQKKLVYHFVEENNLYKLVEVEGSHLMPISYEYRGTLIKKNLPEGHFLEIDYEEGRVKTLKSPQGNGKGPEITYTFSYGNHYTDAFDAMGTKTRYIYDDRFQLSAIERYGAEGRLYRVERKFWGQNKTEIGLLLAKTIEDENGHVHSYRSFIYDARGNVVQENLYGNLTGKREASLQVTLDGKLLNFDQEECHIKSFDYSVNGFNLLTRVGDPKGNQTLYIYKEGSNLLIKKFIFDKGKIKKRTFHTYNDDSVCIKTVEDDGSEEEENKFRSFGLTESHIREIKPKETLPGVGLPEIIFEKALDLKKREEILVKKVVNTYDEHSNLISSETYDADGIYAFTEKKAYNSLGQIISEIDPLEREIRYHYDYIGNPIAISCQDELIKNTYDLRNRLIETVTITAEGERILQSSYDSLGRKVASTDCFGNSTLYEYDAFHRLTKIIHPEVLDETSQIIRPTFTYTYDIFGLVKRIQDPKGFIISKSHNLRGDPTKIVYPDGSFELFKYDVEGSLHRSLTRDQIVTIYEYDYLGRPTYEESSTAGEKGTSSFLIGRSYQYNAFRRTYEREGNHIKRYRYNPIGRLSAIIEYPDGRSEKDPESRLTEISYDPLGRIHKKKVWFDREENAYALECFEYDIGGNVLEKRIEDAEGSILIRRCFSYDAKDQCIEKYTLENNIKTSLLKTSYNSEGEPVKYVDALGRETKIILNTSHQNALGQRVLKKRLISPIGVETEIEFDALSRVHVISKKETNGMLLFSQKIFYDCLGNKALEINDQIREGKAIVSQKIRWNFGPMGRLEEEIEAADSLQEKRICYTYNSLGKMINKSSKGASLDYIYTKSGRLYKIEGKGRPEPISNSYSYDRKGNIKSAYSLHGKSVEREYDAFDQVTKETIKDGIGTYAIEYAYDKKGRVKEIILPDRSKIAYTYDALFGRQIKRLSAKGELLYTHTYDQYDNQGRLQRETAIGAIGSKEYAYDLTGQKIEIQGDFFNEKCDRDPLGRIVKTKGRCEYAYNGLSQLTSENGKIYAYDSLDNRIEEEFLHNDLNQLIQYSKTQLSYDFEGNLIRKVIDGEETHFESNSLSQLVSINTADQTTLRFSYDPFGRLLIKKHLDTRGKNKKTISTARYFYLGQQEIGSLTEGGEIETLKVPGLKGDELALTSVAFEIKRETYVPIHDFLGNVVSLADPRTREVIEKYEYTAFGEEAIYSPDSEAKVSINPWRFAERRIDEETGLIYFGYRFYDPKTHRWTTRDPAGFIDGPNSYAYLRNNPLSYFDRLGLASEPHSPDQFNEYFYGEYESHCFCEQHRTCKRGGDLGKTDSSRLPKITYCDHFEKMYPNYAPSKTFDLGLPEREGIQIGFINGIWNSERDVCESAEYLSKLAGGYNIHAVYNATHGGYADLKECSKGLNYIATEPVRQLHRMWNSFFEKSSTNAKFLMICHSQGAIHVRNALLDYPAELRKRILVVAIAPAAYIYQESCAKVIHYRTNAWRDFVPRLDIVGGKRAKEMIMDLDSHHDAALFDHEFASPTYRLKLQKHINNYTRNEIQKS